MQISGQYLLVIGVVLCFTISHFSPSHDSDLKLIIHDFKCEYGEVYIHYSVINYISYERKNVSVVFKIIRGGRPIACEEQIITIPKNSDGTEMNEAIINIQCEEGSINLESNIFHEEIESSKHEEIEKFLSGCP